MKFRCSAYDRAGKAIVEVVDAADAREASETLRRRGVFVSSVEPDLGARAESAAAEGKGGSVGGGARLKNLAGFSRQLSVLISTGTPLVEALTSVERQAPEGAWRSVLSDLRKRVEEGRQLSEAMQSHPGWFDSVTRSLVAAGESGGRLDAMLDRLARLTRQQQKVRSSIIGAMIYPTLLICVAAGVMVIMLVFVMPRFEGLFKTLTTPLPPSTKLLMAVGQMLREYWMFAVGGLVALGVMVKVAFSGSGGRQTRDRLLVRLPQVGVIARGISTARLARVLGVLLEGKVPLLDALRLAREAAGNSEYTRLMTAAEEAVGRGESVSAVFASDGARGLIAPAVYEAVRSGERSGQMAPALLTVAEALDEDNELVLRSLTSIVEPLILIVLGLVVGAVALSMFLPLFDLTAASGPGPGGGS